MASTQFPFNDPRALFEQRGYSLRDGRVFLPGYTPDTFKTTYDPDTGQGGNVQLPWDSPQQDPTAYDAEGNATAFGDPYVKLALGRTGSGHAGNDEFDWSARWGTGAGTPEFVDGGLLLPKDVQLGPSNVPQADNTSFWVGGVRPFIPMILAAFGANWLAGAGEAFGAEALADGTIAGEAAGTTAAGGAGAGASAAGATALSEAALADGTIAGEAAGTTAAGGAAGTALGGFTAEQLADGTIAGEGAATTAAGGTAAKAAGGATAAKSVLSGDNALRALQVAGTLGTLATLSQVSQAMKQAGGGGAPQREQIPAPPIGGTSPTVGSLTPDDAALRKKAQSLFGTGGAFAGPSSTFLTGPGGVPTSSLNIGRATVLGGN